MLKLLIAIPLLFAINAHAQYDPMSISQMMERSRQNTPSLPPINLDASAVDTLRQDIARQQVAKDRQRLDALEERQFEADRRRPGRQY